MLALSDFSLEVYLEKWEFRAKHHLTASDAESITISELLDHATPEQVTQFHQLSLNYRPTWGSDSLRRAIANTYDEREADDVLVFAGAEEAIFWTLTELLEPTDHAIVCI